MPFADVGSGIKPSSGAKLYFFEVDGVTPKDTYSDQLSTPTKNENPVKAYGTGVFPDIFIDGDYSVTLKDRNLSQIWGGVTISEGLTSDALINDLSLKYSLDSIQSLKSSDINFPVGKKLSTGATKWIVNSTSGIQLLNGLYAKPLNGLTFNDYELGTGAENKVMFDEAMTASLSIIVSAGSTVEMSELDINVDKVKVVNGGNIIVDTSSTTGRGIVLSGKKTKITGGEITGSDSEYMTYLVELSGESSQVDGVEISYPDKPNYVGDGINIPYNTGGVGIAEGVKYCKVTNCEIYNCEGASVYSLGSQAVIKYGHHHDNVLGVCLAGVTEGLSDNSEITGVRIENNDASEGHLSGADGILTFKITKGHSICKNKISGSSEHGTYIQSSKNVITGNHVWDNYFSGLKCGGARDSTISDNITWGNANGSSAGVDDANIYIQSPLGNSTITSNTSSDSGSFGIRVVWLEGKEDETEELRINVSNNIITSSGLASMRLSGRGRFTVSGNICDGNIEIGQQTLNHPIMTDCVISNNLCGNIALVKLAAAKIENNDTGSISSIGCSDLKIVNNDMSAQTMPIPLKEIDVFDENDVTYTNTTDTFFEQGSNKTENSGAKIRKNTFRLSGTRVLFFTAEPTSGDNIQFDNNTLSGHGIQAFYAWGDNHSFCNNKSYLPSSASIGFIRGENCIITSNMGQISTENAATHQVANNTSSI